MYVVPVKSKVKISQNFVAFSEYMNFNVDSRAHLSNTKILSVGFDAIKVSTKMEIPKDLFEGL